MIAAHPLGSPIFRSAFITGGPAGAALPRRRLGFTLVLSMVTHLAGGGVLLLLALVSIDPISAPPITVRFLAAPPPAPRVVPLRDTPGPITKPVPIPRPPASTARMPPLALRPPPAPPRRPEPPPLKVEPAPALKVTDAAPAAPQVALRDQAPPRPLPALGRVAAAPSLPAGRGEEPELVLLTPGKARPRGTGGGIAGREDIAGPADGLPLAADGFPVGAGGKGRGRAGDPGAGASGGDRDLDAETPFDGAGLASFLGRKYGVALVEVSRLGQRTSDGSRYSLLVPMLSEAYHLVPFRGSWRATGQDDAGVASVQVDRESIAIRYRDGVLHVVVPTRDGLVALYISAGVSGGVQARSKVAEAERALRALRRLAQVRG